MTNTETIQNPTNRAFRNPLDGLILLIASRFGSKAKEVERFLKFAVVGVIGAMIDFGILIALQATLLPPVDLQKQPLPFNVALASAISFSTAVTSNFIWTRYWVYPESRGNSAKVQLTQFAIVSVVGGVARTIWISIAYIPLGALLMPIVLPEIQMLRPNYIPSHTAEAKLGTIIAQMIGMVVVMLWNFFANRYWTYKDVK